MAIDEVFPNPTVKSVFFEVRFPNLFFLESKVGDFQLKVLERFPESQLAYRRNFLIANLAPGAAMPEMEASDEGSAAQKSWIFKSPSNYELTLETNRLAIASRHHKTYNLGDGDRFRDIIKFAIDAFLSVVQVPLFVRLGLRYMDECPVPSKDDATIAAFYNTTFPLSRFSIADASEMRFHAVVRRGESSLRYIEQLAKRPPDAWMLQLDFDAYRERVAAQAYLTAADQLHELVATTFAASIKEPVYQYMRQPQAAPT